MVVSAGSYDLNVFLHGGYEPGVISVIYGPSGSGKTNICLLAAVHQALKSKHVIFVDTEGGFSAERVKQLAGEQAELALQHLLVLQPTSFIEQQQTFQKLGTHVKQHASLIVVDGMTMLYRLEIAGKSDNEVKKLNSQLAGQLRTLAELARKHSLPVLITNQVYRWEEEVRMVGGDLLQYWSKCHVELVHEHGHRTLKLRKHRHLREKEMSFEIVNAGIKKRGWL